MWAGLTGRYERLGFGSWDMRTCLVRILALTLMFHVFNGQNLHCAVACRNAMPCMVYQSHRFAAECDHSEASP